MEENQTVLAFKAVCNFVKALNEVFGERQVSLQLYAHLLEKTGIVHEEPIRRHVSVFKHFLKANESNWTDRSLPLVFGELRYSEKVWIDLQRIFQIAGKDEQDVIWRHLVTIAAIVDPTGPAKALLRQWSSGGGAGGDGKEEDFLADLLKKIMDNVDLTSQNPMDIVNSLLSSGALNDIMGSMNESLGADAGGMDFGKLLQTIQTMMGTFATMMNNPPRNNTPATTPVAPTTVPALPAAPAAATEEEGVVVETTSASKGGDEVPT